MTDRRSNSCPYKPKEGTSAPHPNALDAPLKLGVGFRQSGGGGWLGGWAGLVTHEVSVARCRVRRIALFTQLAPLDRQLGRNRASEAATRAAKVLGVCLRAPGSPIFKFATPGWRRENFSSKRKTEAWQTSHCLPGAQNSILRR
jgi:hypothetical protein